MVAPAVTVVAGPAAAAGHRPSHGSLLRRTHRTVTGEAPAAIVVPTIRNPAAMRDALHLGRQLDRPVIALCSRWSSAAKVRAEAKIAGARAIAVDVTTPVPWPRLTCDALLQKSPHNRRDNDVSLKRNLGIVVAAMLGWESVLFLDDDITDLGVASVRTAGGLLRDHNVAALENAGFPDNSVVCHARRAVELPQGTFAGGGAMAVRIDGRTPFFPTIYNEDWMFLVRRRTIEPVAVCGKVSQREYDPFLTPERARSEEFGDCLAEGLFALSERDRPAQAADEMYWQRFLRARITMIDDILRRLATHPDDERRARIVRALKVARGHCLTIDPAFCVRYLRAHQTDLGTWQRFLGGLPAHTDPAEAFVGLGQRVHQHAA